MFFFLVSFVQVYFFLLFFVIHFWRSPFVLLLAFSIFFRWTQMFVQDERGSNCGTDFNLTYSHLSKTDTFRFFVVFVFFIVFFSLFHCLAIFTLSLPSVPLLFLLRFVHTETSKVFEYNVIVVIGVVWIFVTMTFDRFHFLHRIDTLTFNGACGCR